MPLAANMPIWEVWDKAPVEWYFIYFICAYLGILIIYIFWKKYGGYHDSKDDKDGPGL